MLQASARHPELFNLSVDLLLGKPNGKNAAHVAAEVKNWEMLRWLVGQSPH